MFDLLLITPEAAAPVLLRQVELALRDAPPRRVAVQLRANHLGAAPRAQLAAQLRPLTRAVGALLLINGDIQLAREVAADGVQLPERAGSVRDARAALGERALIGASRHDLAGLQAAAAGGADFATLSPIFAVPDKGSPLGLASFESIARSQPLPIVALGGITAERAAAVIRTGARALAVVREVLGSRQPGAALRALLAAIDEGRGVPA